MRIENTRYGPINTLFSLPKVYPIANCDGLMEPLRYIERLFSAGAPLVQLRAKTVPFLELKDLASNAITLARTIEVQTGKRRFLLLNDFVELAREIAADGVHLGQDDMSVADARTILGKDAILGISTHTIEQVLTANMQEVNYIGFGPVFQSPTKSGHAELAGTAGVREARAVSKHPLVAIGGLTFANMQKVFEAGASSVAMISELARKIDLEGIFQN